MALASVFLPLIEPGQVPAEPNNIEDGPASMRNWRNVTPTQTPFGQQLARLLTAVWCG